MHADIDDAIDLMQAHGVRRLLVRDDSGNLVGLVSFDDLAGAPATHGHSLEAHPCRVLSLTKRTKRARGRPFLRA